MNFAIAFFDEKKNEMLWNIQKFQSVRDILQTKITIFTENKTVEKEENWTQSARNG